MEAKGGTTIPGIAAGGGDCGGSYDGDGSGGSLSHYDVMIASDKATTPMHPRGNEESVVPATGHQKESSDDLQPIHGIVTVAEFVQSDVVLGASTGVTSVARETDTGDNPSSHGADSISGLSSRTVHRPAPAQPAPAAPPAPLRGSMDHLLFSLFQSRIDDELQSLRVASEDIFKANNKDNDQQLEDDIVSAIAALRENLKRASTTEK